MKEVISTLNWVDWVIILFLLRGAYIGFREGVLAEILRIFVYGTTFLAAFRIAPIWAPFIEDQFSLDGELARTASIILAMIALFLILRVAAIFVLRIVKIGDGAFFKASGMAAGVLRWVIILSIAFFAIKQANITTLNQDIREKSRFAQPILPVAEQGFEFLRDNFIPELSVIK